MGPAAPNDTEGSALPTLIPVMAFQCAWRLPTGAWVRGTRLRHGESTGCRNLAGVSSS